jgi:hypothetical protein
VGSAGETRLGQRPQRGPRAGHRAPFSTRSTWVLIIRYAYASTCLPQWLRTQRNAEASPTAIDEAPTTDPETRADMRQVH